MPPVFLSFSAMRRAILSADGLVGLIPGKAGRVARAGSNSLQNAVLVMQDEGLEANVNVKAKDTSVKVCIRMI
ncbi:MAG: hypothetical protein FWG31_04480 [Oscillospiraceae bacterium]|nr:hypothetical protein [Oscillospiraceae bacterium]